MATSWWGNQSVKRSSKIKICCAETVGGSVKGQCARKLKRNWNIQRHRLRWCNNVIFMRLKNVNNYAPSERTKRKRRVIVIKDFVWVAALDVSVNLKLKKKKNFADDTKITKNICFRSVSIADINECEEDSGACGNGKCINSIGSYKCQCHKGFRLDNDGRCVGESMQKFSS